MTSGLKMAARGLLILAVGVVITLVTYWLASSGKIGGGTYFISVGAFIVGGWYIISGLYKHFTKKA